MDFCIMPCYNYQYVKMLSDRQRTPIIDFMLGRFLAANCKIDIFSGFLGAGKTMDEPFGVKYRKDFLNL